TSGYVAHTLDLATPVSAIRSNLSSAVRTAIRKAERSELVVRESSELPEVAEFYRLHVATRRRHGLPPQPFSFFRNI
ncbi:hypothetical protein, partial [Enterococcus casseliflavus]|uniref:hypothetical protein n=1 Tax=Enterococcus casseliflavus TaxID=37734 RepID=UPI003D0F2137